MYIQQALPPHFPPNLHLSTPPLLPSLPPARPPPLLPPPTVKDVLAQLPIDLVVGLAHPPSQTGAALDGRGVAGPLHPGAEVVGADPAGVEGGEEVEELSHFGLLGRGGGGGVGGGDGVEEGPGVGAEGGDVGGAVGGGLRGLGG